MSIISSTPKGQTWERSALPVIPSLGAGTYTNPAITVDNRGRVTAISAGAPSGTIGAQATGVGIAGGPFNIINFIGNISTFNLGGGILGVDVGAASIVIKDEGSLVSGMSIYDTINFVGGNVVVTDAGGGTADVNLTANPAGNVEFRKYVAGTTNLQNIGIPTAMQSMVRSISVSITTAYSAGAILTVTDGSGTVWMPSSNINPQLVGTYEINLAANNTVLLNYQMVLVVNGSPAVGSAVIDIMYEKK